MDKLLVMNVFGVCPKVWPEPVGMATYALEYTLNKLIASDVSRCGRTGEGRVVLAPTDMGLWLMCYFLKEVPSGGVCALISGDLKEVFGEPVRFDLDEEGNHELYDAAMGDELAFDHVLSVINALN